MRRTCLIAAAAMLLLASCTSQTDRYVDWLYESMPLPDSLVYSRNYWEQNVAKTLEVRKKMAWNVPEREFRHFVLPVRVNNEALDDFRTMYADTLCARVAGMSMTEAALEINHWCHEHATYQPSDGRTSSPLQTMGRGLGRCGEESVLAVSALRAAGIPARQVYTPRWAHTDDNHAWVEAWVDGNWHFMGACEPEPVLDMGWFNASVSRAMILHTKVAGDYKGSEDVISRNPVYTEINVIRGYVDARRCNVKVVDNEGNAVPDARVEFKIYNYAEFFTVATYSTDSNGNTALDTGIGDMLVWAYKDGMYGFAVTDSDDVTVTLSHREGEPAAFDFDINPPVERPLPALATDEQIAANAIRLKEEDAMRAAWVASRRYTTVPAVVADGLSLKDMTDVTPEVVEDSQYNLYEGPEAHFANAERVEIEMLLPYRKAVYEALSNKVDSPASLALWIKENVKVDNARNPQGLRIPPVAVLRSGLSDSHSRDIFFVAACRALGFPARLEDGTGKTQYFEGGEWHEIDLDGAVELEMPKGELRLSCGKGVEYYRHFTLAKIEDGTAHLLDYDEDSSVAAANLMNGGAMLDEGFYMLTSGVRLSTGGVLAHIEMFNVSPEKPADVTVKLRESGDRLQVLASIDVEKTFVPDGQEKPASILSVTGRTWYILAAMGSQTEPNTHALRQLESASDAISSWGGKVLIVRAPGMAADHYAIPGAVRGVDDGDAVRSMLKAPYVVLADSFGRVVYLSEGYNTSLANGLGKALSLLQ